MVGNLDLVAKYLDAGLSTALLRPDSLGGQRGRLDIEDSQKEEERREEKTIYLYIYTEIGYFDEIFALRCVPLEYEYQC